MSSDRELRAETTIDAPPARVWEVLTDFKRLADSSPELVAMLPLKRGGLRPGQWYLGVNRRKGVVWPTRNVVRIVEPERRLIWDTTSSGARWIFELLPEGAGTHVVARRPVPKRLTLQGRLFATAALGGREEHADELEGGLGTTLAQLKTAAEAGSAR